VIQFQGTSGKTKAEGSVERVHSPRDKKRKTKKWHERTAKKCFSSENNPHDLVRCTQKEKYVWYATYDEEMYAERFIEVLSTCNDKSAPIVIKEMSNYNRK